MKDHKKENEKSYRFVNSIKFYKKKMLFLKAQYAPEMPFFLGNFLFLV
jgi:hypothetical protein